MDVSVAIRTRRAVRRFQDLPVPDEVIEQILHAGRHAQSSKNDQPWQFVVVRWERWQPHRPSVKLDTLIGSNLCYIA